MKLFIYKWYFSYFSRGANDNPVIDLNQTSESESQTRTYNTCTYSYSYIKVKIITIHLSNFDYTKKTRCTIKKTLKVFIFYIMSLLLFLIYLPLNMLQPNLWSHELSLQLHKYWQSSPKLGNLQATEQLKLWNPKGHSIK